MYIPSTFWLRKKEHDEGRENPGLFEIHPRNNYEPMRVEETRKFKIDKSIKKDCGLPGEGIIEIEIKKEKSIVFASTFRMVKPDLGSRVAFIHCNKGYVALVKAQGKAESCGIAKILMQLCINEEGFHNVASNYKNEAVILMGKYVQECLKKESCMANDQQLKKIRNLENWITSHCSKLVYLEMESDPKTGAHVYFNSAVASGFPEMFMINPIWNEDLKFYPNEGPCPVKELQKKYSNDGNMVDDDEKTMVWGWNWFFCQPKTITIPTKCTIL